MDAASLVLGFLFITLVGALASLVGADTRDGFDGADTRDRIDGAANRGSYGARRFAP